MKSFCKSRKHWHWFNLSSLEEDKGEGIVSATLLIIISNFTNGWAIQLTKFNGWDLMYALVRSYRIHSLLLLT